jgi:hypothetical protein
LFQADFHSFLPPMKSAESPAAKGRRACPDA